MPQSEKELAAFQAALLELLAQPLTPEEIRQRLQTGEAFGPYQDYIQTFDLRMIEVAASLVKKWGRQGKTAPPEN